MQRLRPTRRPLFGAALLLLILGSALLAACGDDDGNKTASATPQDYYLALGDSIAFGYQPGKADNAPPTAFDSGYVDLLAAQLRKLAPKIQAVNYGCPGESTVTFTKGGCPWLGQGLKLHDAFRGSQLKAAESFLRAHPDQVSPITVTLWGNDVAPLSQKGKGAPRAIAAVAARLNTILKQLRAAAPDSEIIVTGAWNPEADQLARTQPLYRSLDSAIARAAAASNAHVAQMFPVFNGSGSARAQRARLCAQSFICSQGDVHPTDAGYRAMADAFMAASGYQAKQ